MSAFTLAGSPAVAVVGDDGGLSSAAVMLGGHLPFVWDQKSVTTDKVADDVKEFLAGKGVTRSLGTRLVRPGARSDRRRRAPRRRSADGQRRRSRQGAGGAASVQGDWSARPETRLVVRERAQRADPSARAWFGRGDDRPAGHSGRDALPFRSRPRGGPAAARRKTSISPRSTPTTARWPTPTTT